MDSELEGLGPPVHVPNTGSSGELNTTPPLVKILGAHYGFVIYFGQLKIYRKCGKGTHLFTELSPQHLLRAYSQGLPRKDEM